MADLSRASGLVAAQRLPQTVGHRLGDVIVGAVDKVIVHEWDKASAQAARVTGATIDAKVRALSKSFAKELGTVGAAAGGAAAIPGVGTAASVATFAVDLGWFTTRAARLILTIAALHGHEEATVEERRTWVLSILVFGDGASHGIRRLAGEMGKGLGTKATKSVPLSVLRSINSKLGRTIVTKYGTKRGAIALGRLLPFGFGAAIGGAANYVATRALARHANKFFRDLPYARIPATASYELAIVSDAGDPAAAEFDPI